MEEQNKIEELMKPRYKVIADYPHNPHEIGTILTLHHIRNKVVLDRIRYYEEYPHLFKPLEWWEEREASEMPKYIGVKNQEGKFNWVHKAIEIREYENQGIWYATIEFNRDNEIEKTDIQLERIVLPATSQEYIDFTNTPNP